MTATAARVWLVVAGAMWGMTFIAHHALLVRLAPPQIITGRFLGVALILAIVLLLRPSLRPRYTRRQWGVMAVCGFLAVPGSQLALVYGQRFLSPAMSGLVAATGPAFAAILAVVLLRERLGVRARLGILLACSGAATVVLFASGTGTDLTVRNPAGAALVLVTQLSWAAYTVLIKRDFAASSPITTVATATIIGTLFLLPFVPGTLAIGGSLSPAEIGWFLYLVVFGTLTPYLIWFAALRRLPANETAAFMFFVPLFALGWSALVVGERPSPLGLLGGVGVLVGVALTQASGRRRAPTPEVTTP